jgi:hypothetical protein
VGFCIGFGGLGMGVVLVCAWDGNTIHSFIWKRASDHVAFAGE